MTGKSTGYNTGFALGGLTCKLGTLCFYSSSVLVDSYVLRNPPERKARKRYVQAYPNTSQIQEILIKMSNHRIQILETIENLVEARDIIFTQILNLAMSGEMKHLESAFDLGDKYNFTLKHFESVQDVNVKKLVSLCKNAEETVFSLMNLNGISENEVNL